MSRGRFATIFVLLTAGLSGMVARGAEPGLQSLLATIRAAGAEATGQREAATAWERLAAENAAHLPEILAGMDGAGPMATNWIATAAQAVVERQHKQPDPLPAAALEQFALDRSHSARGRQLAYEIVLGVDAKADERLIPHMLDDPCLEFRRLAVSRLIADGASAAATGDQENARTIYQRALDAARDIEQVKQLAGRLEKFGQKVDVAKQLGYVVHWKLIGSFDNTDRKGFDAVYAPEREFQPNSVYDGKKDEVRWVDHTSQDPQGHIDFFKALGRQGEVVAYAASQFVVAKRQEVELRTSSVNATKLWVAGGLVGEHPIYHSGSGPDQYIDRVTLEPGSNLILVKVCQNEQTQEWALRWEFQLRVCDPLGNPVLSADRD